MVRRSQSRMSPCPICRTPKKAKFPYCLNCHKKAKGRPIEKFFGECAYRRCHKPVATNIFGMGIFPYCPRHQNQHERGLI